MQMISGFLDVAAPYLYLLWLFPVALLFYFLGWLVRGIELTSTINNHTETLSARELKLKKLATQLEKKELLIDQIKTQNATEYDANETLEQTSHTLQLRLNDARNEREQVHLDKKAAVHELDKTRSELNQTQRKLTKYERATRDYEEKFSALRTKYKQRDAKLYGEIVELRAYIFDLKATHLRTEKERNDLRTSTEQLEQIKADSQSTSQTMRSNLKESEDQLQQLQGQVREQSAKHREEIARLSERLKSIETLETAANEKSERILQLDNELNAERKLNTELTDNLQNVTESNQSQLSEFATKHENLSLKYNDLKTESRREIDNLKADLQQLEPLSTINKNQTRTIKTIESKLQDHRKQAEKFQSMAATLVGTQSELEKVTLRLKTTESTLEQNASTLAGSTDKLHQSQFENRKIPSLQNQLKEKDTQLKQLDGDLLKLTRALNKQHEDKIERTKLTDKIEHLTKEVEERENRISHLNIELSTAKQLEDKLADKDIKMAQLSEELSSLPALENQLNSSQIELKKAKTKLDEQIQKNQQIEVQAKTITGLHEEISGQKHTIAQINKSLSSYREKADRITAKDKALLELEAKLAANQKTVQERNNEITALKLQSDKRQTELINETQTLERKCLQIEPLQQALMQSEKKAKSISGDLNRLRLEMAETAKTQQDEPSVATLQQALEAAEANAAKLEHQLKEVQGRSIDNDALRKRIDQLEPLKPALEQAENKAKELHALLSPLQNRTENQAREVVRLTKKVEELQPLTRKLAESESREKTLSSRVDEQLTNALAMQALEEQLGDLQQTVDASATAERLAKEQNAALAAEIEKLEQNNKKMRLAGESVTEKFAELKKLRDDAQRIPLLQQQLSKSDAALEERSAALESSKEQIRVINESAAAQLEELNKLRRDAELVPDLQQQLSKAESALKLRAADLEKTHDQIKVNSESAAAQLKELNKLRRDAELIPNLQQQLSKSEAALNERTAALQNSNEQIRVANESAAAQRNKLQKLQQDAELIAQLQQKLSQSEKNLKERTAALEKRSEEIKASSESTAELRKELETLRRDSNLVPQLQQQLSKSKEELTEVSSALDKSKEELKAANDSVNKQISELRSLQNNSLSNTDLEKQLSHTRAELDKRNAAFEALSKRADSNTKPVSSTTDLAAGTDSNDEVEVEVELAKLRSQVQSLTQERNLGLDRVKELSEAARLVNDKDKLIKQLKLDIASVKINQRELDTLRVKIERSEQELVAKNLAIEELKKMVRNAQKPKKKVVAAGPSVKKTPTTRTRAKAKTDNKDDLKKIPGIGPVLEKLLNEQGITHYQQIAEFTKRDIEKVSAALNTFPGRVTRDDWIGGARKEQMKKYG